MGFGRLPAGGYEVLDTARMGSVSKYGLININAFVACIGLIVMVTSAAVIYQQNKFDMELTNAYFVVSLTTLATGIFFMLLGFLGCIGAIKESPCMLTLYAVVVGLILVAVLTTVIMLLVLATDATNFVVEHMVYQCLEYGVEGEEGLTHDLDNFQHRYQCCGIYGYEDWAYFPYHNGTSVADGCCKEWTEGCGVGMLNKPNVTELVWSKGCLDYYHGFFSVFWITLAILSFILVGFQTLSIAWACILARDSRRYNQI